MTAAVLKLFPELLEPRNGRDPRIREALPEIGAAYVPPSQLNGRTHLWETGRY